MQMATKLASRFVGTGTSLLSADTFAAAQVQPCGKHHCPVRATYLAALVPDPHNYQ
jgi:hypothetical protein